MECKNKCKKLGFSTILYAFMSILTCASTCSAATILVDASNSPYPLETEVGDNFFVIGGGTLKLMPVGYTSGLLHVTSNDGTSYGTLEIYGSHTWLSTDKYVQIDPSATVTLFTDSTNSIEFTDLNPPIGSAELIGTTIIVDETDGWKGKLTWNYGGYTYSLSINTRADIIVDVVVSPTPEQLIQDLIADVEDLNLKEGIDNSLDAKLQNALDALEAANEGQRQDAVNKMDAFINAVEAQSGKWIDVDDANALIASAQEIIDLLLAE